MKNFINRCVSFLTGAVCSLVFFLLPPFINTTAITDQEVSTLSKAIFIPLFLVGILVSVLYQKKKRKNTFKNLGLLFMGVLTVLLAFLNVYHLQMAIPLLKTNSIELVVMWIARGFGGLLGLFCGFSFGSLLEKRLAPYLFFLLGGIITFLLGLAAPKILPFEILFYTIGFLCLITELIAVCKKI